jgi:carboxyl-terminal processing protease
MDAILFFMKKNFKTLLLVIGLSASLLAFNAIDFEQESSKDPEKDKMLLELLTFVIERGHYDPVPIDDKF